MGWVPHYCLGLFNNYVDQFWPPQPPHRAVTSGGGADFGWSVNPISTSRAHYAHHNTTYPPGFSYLAMASISFALQYKLIAFNSDLFYSDCSRRWSFMFFPKSYQNLSQNCKFLLCLLLSVSQSSIITNVHSYFLTNWMKFKLLQKSQYCHFLS